VGPEVHALCSLAAEHIPDVAPKPLVPGYVGCVVIMPDGSRELARAVPDPLAE
jgi:hypothetical protein